MKKYYFFGAGSNCKGAIEYVGRENIIAIIDNNVAKVGTKLADVPIISFAELLQRWLGEEVIITAYLHHEDIEKQLKENGINRYLVFPFLQSSFWTIEQMISYWQLNSAESIVVYGNETLAKLLLNELEKTNKKIYINEAGGDIKLLEEYKEVDKILLLSEVSEKQKLKLQNKNIFDVWGEIKTKADKRYERLAKFKNIYHGKGCFLIGNGPSLKISDLEKLKRNGIITFGCNRIYLLYDKTNWRPDYYVIVDGREFEEEKDKILSQKMVCFFKDFIGSELGISENDIYPFRNIDKDYYPELPLFSDDISETLYGGRTVMYQMFQIAAYMGFSKIYLLGVDFSWGEDGKPTHFCKDYINDEIAKAGMIYKNEQRNAYVSAAKYAETHDFKIYNASRGGNLDVFARVDFDEVVKEICKNERVVRQV